MIPTNQSVVSRRIRPIRVLIVSVTAGRSGRLLDGGRHGQPLPPGAQREVRPGGAAQPVLQQEGIRRDISLQVEHSAENLS